MKKDVKIALVVLGIILLVGIIGGLFLGLNKRIYELNLPQQEKLSSIVIKSNTNSVEVTDSEEIKDIIYVLSGNGRTTKEESIQDYPVNSDKVLQVEFIFKESGRSTLFVYMKNGNYYLEQPYDGIYRISGDEYNSMEKYVRDVENINNESILMTIKDNTLTNSGLTLIMKNNANQTYHYGPQYSLEKYENGKYITFEPKEVLSWNDILYNIKEKEEKEEVIDWTYGYDKLKNGKYRLVRHFTSEENITSSADVSEEFFVEFEIK